jgi:queuine tRNA-ribosyltransferase
MQGPIDPACECHTCRTYSIAYLLHLHRVREPQGWQLLGAHNIHFYLQLMRRMRRHILEGTWLTFYHEQRDVLDARDSYGKPPRHVTNAQRRTAMMKRGRYEIVVREEVGRIRDCVSGETMHSVNEPAQEARSLYVEQSRLSERLQAPSRVPSVPLVIWDVGLGAAANAMAAIAAAQGLPTAGRQMLLVSFENDLDSLELALDHMRWFKHLRHPGPRAVLRDGSWTSKDGLIEWRLVHGDFAACKTRAPAPDIVFFDPFSYKTDGGLWTLDAFRELAALWVDQSVELFTYTSSTSVRAAMLAARFHVAKGRATGPKAETTIALSSRAAAAHHGHELLGAEWLSKWRRSEAQMPLGAGPDMDWRAAVEGHPQFQGLGGAPGWATR